MGFWTRLKVLLKARASSALTDAEDPRQVVDYAYVQQQELLVKLRRGLLDVATAKQQLQQQADKLSARVPRLEDQARRALQAGRQDLARFALERRRTALAEMEGLAAQIGDVGDEEDRLTRQERQLALRLEEFGTYREVIAARYNAAEAEVRVKEALTGVSGELAELGMAVGRVEARTERLQARARVLDTWLDVRSLPSVASRRDYLDAELVRLSDGAEIDQDLAGLRQELSLPAHEDKEVEHS